jgi:hypothetical protein
MSVSHGPQAGISIERGAVEIDDCAIRGNLYGVATNGGFYAQTRALVSSSVISGNETGMWVSYGSTVSVLDSIIADNSAGGIAVRGGNVEITRTFLTRNTAENGGAISVSFGTSGYGYYGGSGRLKMEKSSVFGNQAVRGGGIYASSAVLDVVDSTISGNAATTAAGIFLNRVSAAIQNSTIVDNSSNGLTFGPDPWGGSIELTNNIVANNVGFDCIGDPVSSEYVSSRNLFSDAGCQVVTATDLTHTDPLLLPLDTNGGPTPSHALAPASPAIDAGGDDCLGTDQRGVARPQDGDGDGVAKCDIGAYEFDFLTIGIDIKPDGFPNSINPYSRGVIPVAILGSDTFDVADVDVTTLAFGPGGAAIAHLNGHLQDVNSDGIMDLMLHFRTQDSGITCGDESATLTGETLDGQPIEGTDSIQTVGCRVTRHPAFWMQDQADATRSAETDQSTSRGTSRSPEDQLGSWIGRESERAETVLSRRWPNRESRS